MTNGTERIIGVIGGTGHLGAALARRWAKHGHKVVIGSRDADKARAAADALGAELGREIASGTNLDAARQADIVVVTVPFSSQATVLEEIRPAVAGKIVVDTTVPLVPPKVMRVQLPPEGCAALRAQALLGEDVRLVSAFHNVAAHKLATDAEVECDVLVFGDDKPARAVVAALADDAGLRGLHAGALANSAAAEALTSILIFMNRNYAVDGAGVRITGALAAYAD
ncbi:NADPH-dependent F420 reductase [Aromatoleum toluolicum]|uniref:NADPH-dependent F420 reductase n=1 Tax=Aromatoleum toluolicum TaxID=90060 RepID=A0ABX1NP33_9RHOO|nr:NADPH-dependent F420 reductase [Aromatoleum toluolicum]NMG00972.1 NADPH-dependent F420 reductase [Aromatoleum toluolicum]